MEYYYNKYIKYKCKYLSKNNIFSINIKKILGLDSLSFKSIKKKSREDQLLYHNFRKIKIEELIRTNCDCKTKAESCEKTCGFIMAGSDTPESDWDTTLNDINI